MTEIVETSIPLGLIDLGTRLRPVDQARAAAISESMALAGQLTSITVRPEGNRYVLVIGGHRLAAAKYLGWSEIKAKIEDMTALQARLKEIDENLYRAELIALDRAIFLAERKAVWEELNPETAHGGDRKSLKNQTGNQVANLATRFSTEASESLGISERSIRRACLIAEQLSPKVIEVIRATYLAEHQGDLERLARMQPDDQVIAARAIAADKTKTLATAFPGPEVDPQEELFRKFLGIWSRAGAKAKRRMLRHVEVEASEIDRIVNPRAAKKGKPN